MVLHKPPIPTIENVKNVSLKEKPGNQAPMSVQTIARFQMLHVLSTPALATVRKSVLIVLMLLLVWPVSVHGIKMKNSLGVETNDREW